MTTLQPSSNITDGAATQGAAKSFLANQRLFINELLGADSADKVGVLQALMAPLNGSLPKSGAYTVVDTDRGKVIQCTGTWTLGIDDAASLGDGFVFGVWNVGSGVITVDPYLSEQIDGATTKDLAAGQMALIYCDGTKFATPGLTGSIDADTLDGLDSDDFAQTSGATAATYFDAEATVCYDMSITTLKRLSRRVNVSGTITVRFGIASDGSATTYGAIYVNGASVGTNRSTTSSAIQYYSEDITVAAGDVVQIYGRSTGGSVGSIYGIGFGSGVLGACLGSSTRSKSTNTPLGLSLE